MSEKGNKKQNETSHSLYVKLKQALNNEKNYVRLDQKKLIKKRVNTFIERKSEIPLSCSLNLNESILKNEEKPEDLRIDMIVSKGFINLESHLTPYQTRKSLQMIKIDKNLPRKQTNIELHKKNFPDSTKILSIRQQRIHKFFKPRKSKTEPIQNEENLTYSMILKSFNHSQNLLESQKSTINHTENSEKRYSTQKCGRCSYHSQEKTALFFKNEEIKKNIAIIEEMKSTFKSKQTDFKHFPQVQVLNLSYFNENKKKIVNKINFRQNLTSLQKIKLLTMRRKFLQMQCPKCKSIQKQIEQSRKQKVVSNLIKYPSNFQYSVYEYKPAKKSQKLCPGQSTLSIKKNKFNQKNINNQHKMNATTSSFSNEFQKFMMHNKIEVPPRPQTAVPVKTCNELFHYRISHPCPTEQHRYQNVINKMPNEQNFVKPWESSAMEIDNQF